MQITITDAELNIMKVLWKKSPLTSSQIFAELNGCGTGNRSTQKTLLLRLVKKGAVDDKELTKNSYLYYPAIKQEEYVTASRKRFLEKVFDGSAKNMILNFIEEEKISKDDLRELIDLIREKEK